MQGLNVGRWKDKFLVFLAGFFVVFAESVCLAGPTVFLDSVSERVVVSGSVWDTGNLVYHPDSATAGSVHLFSDGSHRLEFNNSGDFSFLVSTEEDGVTYCWRENVRVVNEPVSEEDKLLLMLNHVIDRVNQERTLAGLVPLRIVSDLMKAADVRAREISVEFSHTRPDGSPCSTVVKNRGNRVGENIAGGYKDVDEVVVGFLLSTHHRENVLEPEFREIGIGYYYDPGSVYKYHWVQLFRG